MTPSPRHSFAALLAGLCLVVGATACGSGSGSTAAASEGAVTVQDATIDRPLNPATAAIRMVVRNETATADELRSVSSPVAETATVHRSETDAEGRSVMTAQPELALPARSSVTFAPGGLHVMLTGITDDLAVGDEVPFTLTFEHADPVTATAVVVEPGNATEGSHDH